jgi:phage terminase large subunit GpA-like protein
MSERVSRAAPAVNLQSVKVELKVAQAALNTAQAREDSGELMSRRRYDERSYSFLRGSIRDRLGNMGARHAAVLAAKHSRDPNEVVILLEDALAGLSAELAQLSDDPAHSRALRPDPRLTVSEWADHHRVLSSRGSAEPGPYRTSRTPYLKEIMDSLSANSAVQRVVFMKGAQLGATECANNFVGYCIDQVPGPVLVVQPTVDLAKRFSKQRVDTMIEESPRLRERVAPTRSRDSGNTVLAKEFPGGILVMTGANSAVGLRSMPARYLVLDECDAYPGDTDGEGSPVALAEARTRTFAHLSKTFLISTPLMKGTSVIEREYERSDQRRYFVPCPLCRHPQTLVFERLRYDPEKMDAVHYECEGCGGAIVEAHKTEMLARGFWQATATSGDPRLRGYHLSSLYSPAGWFSWLAIVRQWENEATKSVDARKAFINTVLGEAFSQEAGYVPDWQRLYDRREEWPHEMIPEHGLFLTAGADVQLDRIEVDVWAWGRGLTSWLVGHYVLDGDTARPEVWEKLVALMGRTWEHSSGKRMGLQRLAIDTGAFTQSVYAWARTQDRNFVLPVKGMPNYDRLVPVSGPTKVEVATSGHRLKVGLNLWTVSVSFFKREFYRQLELNLPTDEARARGEVDPPGYVHISTGAGDEWVKQCVSEQQVVVRSRQGFAVRTEWQPLRVRNEALDCRVYARAAVWLAGADRWPESRWRDLEAQLGIDLPPPKTPAAAPAPIVPVQPLPPVFRPPIGEMPAGMRQADIGGQINRASYGRRVIF